MKKKMTLTLPVIALVIALVLAACGAGPANTTPETNETNTTPEANAEQESPAAFFV